MLSSCLYMCPGKVVLASTNGLTGQFDSSCVPLAHQTGGQREERKTAFEVKGRRRAESWQTEHDLPGGKGKHLTGGQD